MENGETMEERKRLMDQSRNTTNNSSDKVMGGHDDDDNDDDDRHRPLLSTNGGDDGGGGPTLNDSGANEVGRSTSPRRTRDISRDDVSAANAHGADNYSASAVTVTNLTTFRSPGGGMAAALGFPFTALQWKELERQAMIYKYMVASLPVPPDLLVPISSRNFSDPTAPLGNGSLYGLRYQNRDPEPGRCKRTDGKKWRCSRDVAPHQKYCERHMHRGRPRSRKPVEVHPSVDTNNNNKKTRLNNQTPPPLQTNPTGQEADRGFASSFLGTAGQIKDPLIHGDARATAPSISRSLYKEPNRALGWMMSGEMVATNGVEEQWLHLMDTKRGLPPTERHSSIYGGTNSSILHHGFAEEPPNLFSYTDLPREEDIRSSRNNDDCHLFLNSDLISLKQPQMEDYPISRGFIDAWSNGNLETINNEPSISSSQGKLSPSSLNLSIAMAADSADHHKDCPPVSNWLPFSSGGPLAEVLQPSYMAGGSNPASPYASNADSISPPATSVSSPSGVLQRALFSQSDGSVCNSPNIALSTAPPELVAFQWLS